MSEGETKGDEIYRCKYSWRSTNWDALNFFGYLRLGSEALQQARSQMGFWVYFHPSALLAEIFKIW